MTLLNDYQVPVFFVTPDINYGLAFVGLVDNFYLITLYDDPLLQYYQDKVEVFCLEQHGVVDYPNTAGHILQHELSQRYIAEHSVGQQPRVVYFKPSPKLDKVIGEQGYLPIGIDSKLNRCLEDKLELSAWADGWMPGFEKGAFDAFDYGLLKQRLGDILVVQTARGWAGQSTWLVRDFEQWQDLGLGQRQVRVSSYLFGKVLTVNGVIWEEQVLWGQVGRQVNPPDERFSSNPMATVGRIWDREVEYDGIYEWLAPIGGRLQQQGHQGWFGLDVIQSEGQYYLIEVNPRMTASTSFYTRLELQAERVPLVLYHLQAFEPETMGLPPYKPANRLQGSQVLLRYHGSPVLEHNSMAPRTWSGDGWLSYETQLSVDRINTIGTAKPEVSEGTESVRFESLEVLVSSEGRLSDRLARLLSQKGKIDG